MVRYCRPSVHFLGNCRPSVHRPSVRRPSVRFPYATSLRTAYFLIDQNTIKLDWQQMYKLNFIRTNYQLAITQPNIMYSIFSTLHVKSDKIFILRFHE